MRLREVICSSTCPANANSGSGSIALHDIETGTALASWKQTSAARHSTLVVETKDGLGGLMLAAQQDKALINVYSFQKDQLHLKMVLPEKLTCIATSPSGTYCAGGTATGRIYLWEMASGIMFNAFEAHYRKINVLRFTRDGAALVSGSEDSGVSVWLVSKLVDVDLQNENAVPYCSLSDHTLPVHDIACGFGPFPKCRILSCSSDNTCKLWDLSTSSLIATFIFPRPITLVALDPSERVFFAASEDGFLHQVNLFRKPLERQGHRAPNPEALTVGEIQRIEDSDESGGKRLISVGQQISSICISMTGSLLLVGTSAGLIQIYDISSHQLLRTIQAQQGLLVTHLSTMVNPPDLIGHIGFGQAARADPIPIRPICSFQRVRDPVMRARHDVLVMIPPQAGYPGPLSSSLMDDVLQGHRYFASQAGLGGGGSGPSLQTRVAELEAEVQNLQQNLAKAKGINDAMWSSVVQTVLRDEEQPSGKGSEPPAKKRGRLNRTSS